ncbi:GNAT family N-acetyltransferase [Micromonospora sp. NPDC050397]|uniref:GNAT family N-acetyltransferase n=1 Tax=Micromonospora sp. NPDC050397 TaxID=3364279 RepID=UPI00384AD9B3
MTARPYDHPDAARLLRAFYEDQVSRYGFAEPVDADPAGYAPPRGVFLVVYREHAPIGCGGYRWFDRTNGTIEIKKTYTIPEVRGTGVGRVLLSALEQHGVMNGASHSILETGVRNHAALALFRSLGYQPTHTYVASRDPKINRAFVKTLIS